MKSKNKTHVKIRKNAAVYSKVRKGAQLYNFGSKEDRELIKRSKISESSPADIRAWTRNGML